MRNADAKTDTPLPPPPPRIMCRDAAGNPPVLKAGENTFYHMAAQDQVTGRLVCILCKLVM